MTCICCGRRTGRKTKEHGLPDGLGGTVTPKDSVRHDCNTGRYSKVDGNLIVHVRIIWLSLRGVHHQPKGLWMRIRDA